MVADVAVSMIVAVVVHRHTGAAVAADHQPLQKRVTIPGRASSVRHCPVVPQLPDVLLVGLPSYVGRQPILEKYMPASRRGRSSASGAPSGLSLTGIDPTPAIGVGSGVDRVFEHVLKRRLVGSVPL